MNESPIIELASSPVPGTVAYAMGPCRILVGIEGGLWHLSISCKDRYPSWDEIKRARYKLMPDDIHVALLFPPSREYVKHHPNTFHLHELTRQEFLHIPGGQF